MVFNRRWLKIGSGVGAGVVTILGLFILLQLNFGFQITDITGDIYCDGTYDSPCLSEFQVKNPTKYNVDIYSKDQVKLDFSPDISDYALFVKDGRCGPIGSCACELKNGKEIGFKGWRCVDFTNKTKPLKDKEYNFRFASYSNYNFLLAGIKNNPDDTIKWGFGVNTSYLDPFWYGLNDSQPNISVSNNITMELGSKINITTNITGVDTVCVDIDHPDYGDNYTCGSPNANFLFNISYFRETEFNDGSTEKTINADWTEFNGTIFNGGGYGTSSPSEWCAEYSMTIPDARKLRVSYYVYSWIQNENYYSDVPVDPQITIRDENRELLETVIDTDYNESASPVGYSYVISEDLYESGLYGFCIKIPFAIKPPQTNYTLVSHPTNTGYTRYKNIDVAYNYDVAWVSSVLTSNNGFGTNAMKHVFVYKNGTNQTVEYTGLSIFGDTLYNSTNPNPTEDVDYVEMWLSTGSGSGGLTEKNTTSFFYTVEGCTSSCNGGGFSVRNDNGAGEVYTVTGSILSKAPDIKTYVQNDSTFYISSHQYADVQNLSINITGIETATGVSIYVNGTLSNTLGVIYNTSSGTISETEETIFSLVNGNSTTFRIPKGATVTNTTLNFSGINNTWEISERFIPQNAYGVLGSPSSGTPSWFLEVSDAWDGNTVSGTGLWLSPLYGIAYTGNIYENYTKDDALIANWTAYFNSYPDAPFIQYCWGGSWIEIINDITIYNPSKITEVEIPSSCLSQPIMQFKTTLEYDGTSGRVHWSFYVEGKMNYYRYGFPENLIIEVGITDGFYEYEGSGELTGYNSTTDFVSEINTFLETCTADSDDYCDVPIYFSSDDGGILNITNFEVLYTYDPNPISISSSIIQSYLDNSINDVDIPIYFSMESGSFNVSDLRYDYRGGNDTIELFAYDTIDTSNNETLNLINYYSGWDYSLPSNVNYLEFIPKSSTAKNVTPYGQTNSIPILNISFLNYGGRNSTLGIYLNETNSCVNLTIGTNSNKSNGIQLTNNTWTNLLENRQYLNYSGLWMWSDYNCSYSYWNWWSPDIYFRNCAYGVDYCSEDLS